MKADRSFPDAGNQPAQSGSSARLRWERITEIVSAAWEMPPESRLTYIARTCGSDASLRGEVERLLDELENMSGFLDQSPGMPYDQSPVQPGSRLGHYLLGEKIGEGGMGIVFKAMDTRLSRRVAVKLLRGSSLGGNSGKQRFFQEARMMASLNHPSVVTIYDVGTTGDLDFIAMEYVDGRPLDVLLAESRLPPAKALAVARQIGSAVSLAHSFGIVHRDLKPGNIIIGKDDVPKVLDFGLAKWTHALAASADAAAPARVPSPVLSDLTIQGDIMGTVAYMSPEQAAGDAVDERSDVFSFGAVLYEMLSGRKAFGRPTQNGVLQAIANEQPPGLRQTSPAVTHRIEAVIFSCLRKNPAERPAMAAVVAELESAARGSRRIGWWIAVAAVLLAALSAALWTFRGRQYPEPVQLLSRPITAYPGEEFGPSFSPDGTQFAFAWKQPETRYFEVYTRALEGGAPKPLVAGSTAGHHPVWSPSGNQIAFVNEVNGISSIYVVPSQGGVPREIVSTGLTEYILSPALTWSEDSQWIAYSGMDPATGAGCIFAVAPETGLVHKLTQPKPGEKHGEPALSRDKQLLAFRIDRDGVSSIGLVKLKAVMLPDGEARELHIPGLETTICSSPLWRPASGELIFKANKGEALSQLWSLKVDANGSAISAPRLIGNLGEGVMTPALSRTGKRLAFARHIANEDVNVVDLTAGSGAVSRPLLASAYRESWPRYSPDGKRIAFESDHGGFAEVWLANADGSDAFALTNFHGPVTGSPAWSPDGEQIAFDTRATGVPEVYTIRAEKGAQPRRIASGGAGFLPAWSADGRFLYFVSNRTGQSNIWRVSAEGGQAVQISQKYGFDPQPSPDGRYVYFFAGRSQHAPIHRIDLTTSKEEPVVEDAMDRGISVTARGVYYLRRRPDEKAVTLRLFEPARNRDSALNVLPAFLTGGLDVSKDDRSALIEGGEYLTTDLMLVEDLP